MKRPWTSHEVGGIEIAKVVDMDGGNSERGRMRDVIEATTFKKGDG